MVIYVKPNGTTVVSNDPIGVGSHVGRVDIVAPSRPSAAVEILVNLPNGLAVPAQPCAPMPDLSIDSVGVYYCVLKKSITSRAGTVRYQIKFTYSDGTIELTPGGSFTIQRGVIVAPPDEIDGDTYEEIKQILTEINANYASVLQEFDDYRVENANTLAALHESVEEVKGIASQIPRYGTKVVNELPTDKISAHTIYLVRRTDVGNDRFDEYLFIPTDQENIKLEYNGSEGFWEKISSGSAIAPYATPFFDLADLGLPTVDTDGTTADLVIDTTDIRAALDNGAVKFAMNVDGVGRAEIIMSKSHVVSHGLYVCVYTGINSTYILMVAENALTAAIEPIVKLPTVTGSDNGKVLGVVNGAWTKIAPSAVTISNIPFFDLASMGLPTVKTDGTTSDLTLDTTDICAALDKGAVKFALNVDGSGAVEVVMTKYEVNGLYLCTYTIFNLTLTLMIATNGIQASATAVSSAATYNGEVEVI